MNPSSVNRLACENVGFPAADELGSRTKFGIPQPFCSDTTAYKTQAEPCTTAYHAAPGRGTDLIDLPHIGKAAKRMWRNSDPARAKLQSEVVALLPRASSRQLEEIKRYLEKQLQPQIINSNSFPALNSDGSDTELGHASNSCSTLSRAISDPYQKATPRERYSSLIHNSPNRIISPDNTGVPPSSAYSNPNIRSSSSHTTGSYNTIARASLPIQNASHRQVNHPRAHLSAPSKYFNGPSDLVSSHGPLGQELYGHRIGDTNRYSEGSSSTDPSLRSNHSSKTTVDSQASLSNGLSQATISSSATPGTLLQYHQTASPADTISNNPARMLSCMEPLCVEKFTRKADKERHQGTKHGGAKYTCLLDVCNTSCSNPCTLKYHNKPFQNARPDKLKAHLASFHNISLKQKDIPKSWRKPYEQSYMGWLCSDCREYLGNWEQNEDGINNHSTQCALWDWSQEPDLLEDLTDVVASAADPLSGLQNGLKRWSIEDIEKLGTQTEDHDAYDELFLDGKKAHSKGPDADLHWG
jgi:hypothetical protein